MLTLSSRTLPRLPVQYTTSHINHQTDIIQPITHENAFDPDSAIRIIPDVDVEVDFDRCDISYTTIGTTSLSSCTFILVTGNVDTIQFAYLWHTPLTDDPATPTAVSLLEFILKRISNEVTDLILLKPPKKMKTLECEQIKNLQILTGGSVDCTPDLLREAFLMLNNQNVNIEIERWSKWSQYYYYSLKNKVTILSPVTFLIFDEEENEGRHFFLTTFQFL
ncbi:unnamed protein product [Rotaria sordida]|uniref:Uncharacterized protein n=2 Tax=Rotaria sordida TaxID=392033 RepID=A0A814UPZ8_9BILA|nr:unnamed protein product [Rotaria sordida]CAF1257227.1 unnamed protein product [Rotaria sordida]CAF1537551.1 unnamed protein product [Rotaria sordida]CAF4110899.1 unnamed protein product [Rotaria sordida]